MRIESAQVQLSATHEQSVQIRSETTLTRSFGEVFSMAAQAEEAAAAEREKMAQVLQSLVAAIIAAMDGKKVGENLAESAVPHAAAQAASEEGALAGGLAMHWHATATETICESEKTSVCGKGVVKTTDGRAINFEFATEMSRQFTRQNHIEQSGTVILHDPLVLNFAGKACELLDRKINFDLDADGRAEEIPELAQGAGYLVFDRNGNGRADDGSELFGTQSGDGFADLSALDNDHNGWVDEGDGDFSRLGIWADGQFSSLAQRGVGALYTGAVDAQFSLKGADNGLLGVIRAAGVYLKENGEVGGMQQVDLAVSTPPTAPLQPDQGEQLAA